MVDVICAQHMVKLPSARNVYTYISLAQKTKIFKQLSRNKMKRAELCTWIKFSFILQEICGKINH